MGEKLRVAATEPAWNVQHSAAQVLCDEIGSVDEICGERAAESLSAPGEDGSNAGEIRDAE